MEYSFTQLEKEFDRLGIELTDEKLVGLIYYLVMER